MAGYILMVTFLICGVTIAADQTPDPLSNFCRRFGHQTALIDNKLYIDGGYVDYGTQIDSSTVNYTNPYLLYADTSTAQNQFPVEYNSLTKSPNVPDVAGGTLWADEVNKRFYLYGGEYNWTAQVPAQFNLWSFDTIYNNWTVVPRDGSIASISPNAYGASAVNQNTGIAYYYGGYKSNATSLGYAGSRTAQPGLVSYDMVQNQWKSSRFINDDTPRAEGALFYIPASDNGMLVYFGGVQNVNGTVTGAPMDTIYVYDILSGKAYQQKTSGNPPSKRRLFCGGVSWPADRSSYNIYLYGGLAAPEVRGIGFTDVWILSIPSFTWISYVAAAGDPHHTLTCNVVNQGQMIVMGGYFPNASMTDCDAPNSWGMHNLNLGARDVAEAPWYEYLPNITTYELPPNLTAVVGGSSTGGATLMTPAAGFNNQDLGVYFTRKASTSTRTATRAIPTASGASLTSTPASKTNVGAIAGGVVGGVAALAIILAIIVCCLCRRRRRRKNAKAETSPPYSDNDHTPPAPIAEAPVLDSRHYDASHKRDASGSSQPYSPGISSMQSSPHLVQGTNWQPVQPHQMAQMQPQPQAYYPPPPQAQPYYPPPPNPQQAQTYAQPVPMHHEMPNVRSPASVQDLNTPRGGGGSPRMFRTPGQHTINEE